ncbi:DUF433 domain-containing protein [Roseofilum sp. BLCC_M154]|uniref:DUF433 domain-containing protein n=1 Tax=Roseofilum acuticapitatum BLCC-M154 TaxID=3022444 RepID=A0ABT7AQI7_9CYAN|nr:DUF433 domain-containing protein [Roseofilum acuticapitatum]MDJ1169145.1 DUF433 domain-containing protein [Roseofilum acuticapitatum BLCC-M154]
MQVTTDIGTLIVQTPETCGNLPRIAGTRVTVQNIVIDFQAGMKPEEILAQRINLTPAQVYAALAYYYANQGRIDRDIKAYYEECDRLEREYQNNQVL